jgi:hypothetical protein
MIRIGSIEVSDWEVYGDNVSITFIEHKYEYNPPSDTDCICICKSSDGYSLWFGETWIYELICQVTPNNELLRLYETIDDAKASVDYYLKKLQKLVMFL